jgi:imidazolonepropionase-like amidohydrolase
MKRGGGVEPFERFRIGIGGPEEAESVVDRLARKGVDFLKIRSVSSVETYRAIAAAARRYGLTLVGHPVAPPEEILRAGQRSIEHGFYPPLGDRTAEQRRELFRQFRSNGIAMVPTFVVGEVLLVPYARMKAIAEDQEGRIEPKRKYLSGYLIKDWREQVEEQKEPWPGLRDYLAKRLREVREMLEADVRIMPGTDTAVLLIWPGFSVHDELRIFVDQLGMTPMQAIVSATRSPAEFFGLQESLGTIEKEKLADMVLLQADPLTDIANTSRIEAVIRDGKLFGALEIQRLLAEVASTARRQDHGSK